MWIVWQCQITTHFLMVHSSDQCKVCCPLTSLHVRQSPKPFLTILEYCKKSTSEAGEGLGTRLCILFASYPACCQDYAMHNFATFSDSYSCSNSSCSWSIWTLYCLRQPTSSGCHVLSNFSCHMGLVSSPI